LTAVPKIYYNHNMKQFAYIVVGLAIVAVVWFLLMHNSAGGVTY
jgi:hypothetical protein